MLISLLVLLPVVSSANSPSESVTVDLDYQNKEAAEVYLVWGLTRDWLTLPIAQVPAGTRIKQHLMYTPMTREEGRFKVSLRVPAGSEVNYMFYITRDVAGQPVEAWDKEPASDDGYRIVANQSRVVHNEKSPVMKMWPLLAPEGGRLISKNIGYTVPGVREVWLAWGVNKWQFLPEGLRPSGTYIEKHMMFSPMYFDGEGFSAALNLPEGAELNYVFLITRLDTGKEAGIWQIGDPDYFRLLADHDGSVQVSATQPVIDLLLAATFDSKIGFWQRCLVVCVLPALIVTIVVYLSVLLARRGWTVFARIEQLVHQEATLHRLSAPLMRAVFWAPWVVVIGFIGYLYLGLQNSMYTKWFLDVNDDYVFKTQVIKENGFVEISTVLFLFLASVISLGIAYRYCRGKLRSLPFARLNAGLFLLLGIGAFFIAGEEISWGQWLFHFDTPENWAELNSQKEFNLHNLEIFQRGGKELPLIVFGLGGLISRWFIRIPPLKVLAAPRIELGWFVMIVLLSVALYLAYWPGLAFGMLSFPETWQWYARQYAEVIEMMVGMSAFLFSALKYRALGVRITMPASARKSPPDRVVNSSLEIVSWAADDAAEGNKETGYR